MTLVKPNRDRLRNAYAEFIGIDLSETILDLVFKMFGLFNKSRISGHFGTIEWDGEIVNIIKR